MVGELVTGTAEPERGDFREDDAAPWYTRWQYNVKGGDPVRGDEQQRVVTEVIRIANLAAMDHWEVELGFNQGVRHGFIVAHGMGFAGEVMLRCGVELMGGNDGRRPNAADSDIARVRPHMGRRRSNAI